MERKECGLRVWKPLSNIASGPKSENLRDFSVGSLCTALKIYLRPLSPEPVLCVRDPFPSCFAGIVYSTDEMPMAVHR